MIKLTDRIIAGLLFTVLLAAAGGCAIPNDRPSTKEVATPTTTTLQKIGVWTDVPSYSVGNTSPQLFKLDFDPKKWDLVPYMKGHKLVHRLISDCEILPVVGGELPEGYSVEHDTETIGGISYGANHIFENGQLKYNTYFTRAGLIQTGFQIINVGNCINDGEVVLGTYQSVDNANYTPSSK